MLKRVKKSKRHVSRKSSKKRPSRVYGSTARNKDCTKELIKYAQELIAAVKEVEEELDTVHALLQIRNPELPPRRVQFNDMEERLKILQTCLS